MKKYSYQTIYILLILLISCEYEPEGIYERQLDNDAKAPNIDIIKLDLSAEKDTIELMYNRVHFQFKSSNQAIKWINFYLNDRLIGTVESENGFFDLNHNLLTAGNHRLKLELITETGTGSIAEAVGMEGFVFQSKEWIIIVRNIDYNKVTSDVSNGFLKLRFPKSFEKIPEFIVFRNNVEIGRTTSYEFIDKGYVGEGAKYYVRYRDVQTGDLINYGWIEMPNEIEINYIYDDNNNYAVEWINRKYYNAVDSVIILSTDEYYSNFPKNIDKSTDISKVKFQIPCSYFGQLRKYWMVLTPKYYNPVYETHYDVYSRFSSPKIECEIGYPSPIFEYFTRINKSEFIYHTSMYDHGSTSYNDSIFRYSIDENRIKESFRYNPSDYSWTGDHYWRPSTSPNGKDFFAIVGFTQTAIMNPTQDFSNYKIIDISEITTEIMRVPISNVGIAMILSSRKVYIYDYKQERILASIDNTISLSDYNISADGEYFFIRVSHTVWMFHYDRNYNIHTLEEITMSDPIGIDYFNFKQNEPNRLVSWDKATKIFSILECPSYNTISSFEVNEEEIIDIDYFTDRILSFSPNLLVVRSLIDGTIQYEIPVMFTHIFRNNCCLIGNSIFHENGARYFLN